MRKVPKPRDLGLLLHVLLTRVPPEKEICPGWIEKARAHCKMKPGRLAELQQEPHTRHWTKLEARRKARLAFIREHGRTPYPGEPVLPGEPNREAVWLRTREYRKGGLAKFRAKLRKNPEFGQDKIGKLLANVMKIRSPAQRFKAMHDVEARFSASFMQRHGKLKMEEFRDLQKSISKSHGNFPGVE